MKILSKFYIIIILLCMLSGCVNMPSDVENIPVPNSPMIDLTSNEDNPIITDPYGVPLFDTGEAIEPQRNFPLYAALPKDDFYLYGIYPTGMVLYHENQGHYFDWPGLTPRLILPEMAYYDYDGDGEKELAVTVYYASGTGLALMDLHIIKINKSDSSWPPVTYYDYTVSSSYNDENPTDIEKLLGEDFPFTLEDNGETVHFMMDDKSYIAHNKLDEEYAGLPQKIVYGNIVYFNLHEDNHITVDISIGFQLNFATPAYFANVIADVNFDGEKFSFTNKRISFEKYN